MAKAKHNTRRNQAHDRKPRFPLAAFYIKTEGRGGKGEVCVEVCDVIFRDRDIGKWFIDDAHALLDHIEMECEKKSAVKPVPARKAKAKAKAEKKPSAIAKKQTAVKKPAKATSKKPTAKGKTRK